MSYFLKPKSAKLKILSLAFLFSFLSFLSCENQIYPEKLSEKNSLVSLKKADVSNKIKRPTSCMIKQYISEKEYTLVRFDFSYLATNELNKIEIRTFDDINTESFSYRSFDPFLKIVRNKDGHTLYKYHFHKNLKKKDLISDIIAYSPSEKEAVYKVSLNYDIEGRLRKYETQSKFKHDYNSTSKVSLIYKKGEMTDLKGHQISNDGLKESWNASYIYCDNLVNPFYDLFFGGDYSFDKIAGHFSLELAYQKNMILEESLKLTDNEHSNEFKLKYEYLKTKDNYPLHYTVNYDRKEGEKKVMKEVWLKYE